MEDYFTSEEIDKIETAFSDLKNSKLFVHRHKDGDKQRDIFFDKARLWTAIKRAICSIYIDKLISGDLMLCDMSGNEYTLTLYIPGENSNEDQG